MSAFYHMTNTSNVGSIQRDGLRLACSRSHIGYGMEPRIWLAAVEAEDPQWYTAAAIFRVDLPKEIQPMEVTPGKSRDQDRTATASRLHVCAGTMERRH